MYTYDQQQAVNEQLNVVLLDGECEKYAAEVSPAVRLGASGTPYKRRSGMAAQNKSLRAKKQRLTMGIRGRCSTWRQTKARIEPKSLLLLQKSAFSTSKKDKRLERT